LQEWGLTLDWFKYNSPDQFVSITSTTEQFIRINHQFSGRKVATLIPHSRKFDWCFQVECSEYFLENKNETISQILSEIVQFITNENGEYNGKN
jgi:hypothetical protein